MGHSRRAQELAKQLPTPSTERPGMMFYFEDWKNICKQLNAEQVSEILDAVMTYGESGKYVKSDDTFVNLAFNLLRQKIDYDRDSYITSVWQGRYMAKTRHLSKANKPSFEEWLEMQLENPEQIDAPIQEENISTTTEIEIPQDAKVILLKLTQ